MNIHPNAQERGKYHELIVTNKTWKNEECAAFLLDPSPIIVYPCHSLTDSLTNSLTPV